MLGRKQDRLLKQEIYAQKVAQSQTQHHSAGETLNKNDSEEFLSDLSENDTEFTLKVRSGQSKQMRERLPTVAKMADRFALSDPARAAIATASLRDLEIIRKANMAKAIDPFKIRRERKKARVETLELQRSLEGSLQGLYFDGERNVTLQSGKKKVVEEHISSVSEPGSKYIGHVTPSGGLAIDLADSILQFLEANNYDLTQLKVVGADGTAHNTGHIGGAITLLENRLGKSLQWQICLLHFNELPLRHLILHLDGTTSGPNSFTGPIGKQLKTCEEKPIVKFNTIRADLPEIDPKLLSTDQKYLLEICNAVSTGDFPDALAKKDPGLLCHARWLTAANRILRLYVTEDRPSKNLKMIAKYIIRVYAPVWFMIKRNWQFYFAIKHVWQSIKLSRYLPEDIRAVAIDPYIQLNGYALHPENMLVTMLSDSRTAVRKRAVELIVAARSNPQQQSVRQFHPPQINFSARDYPDLIEWKNVTPPPALRGITDQELEEAIEDCDFVERLPQFPCHTQAVERTVRFVTQASTKVCGTEARDGLIRNTLESIK
ncbi:Transcription antitermination protein NusB [Frankliniella fusca]|uniref:Transcription antitermination protein NusB n=1 Tax=Frankliniella fusca TaxID=407009 RepID=A0AAE1GUK9_9NEOP|nr:Transcription antitermination protein NusB [Frankliniella fusca]